MLGTHLSLDGLNLPPRHEATAAMRKLSTTDGPAFSFAANVRIVKIPVPRVVERPMYR